MITHDIMSEDYVIAKNPAYANALYEITVLDEHGKVVPIPFPARFNQIPNLNDPDECDRLSIPPYIKQSLKS